MLEKNKRSRLMTDVMKLITKLKQLGKERQKHIYIMLQGAAFVAKHKSKDQV